MTHGVGKRSATRHDQQRFRPRGALDAPQCRFEAFCMSQKPAAEFHYRLDVRANAAYRRSGRLLAAGSCQLAFEQQRHGGSGRASRRGVADL